MSVNILDRVLSSRENKTRQEFNPLELLNILFKLISGKEAEVLRRRFGLNTKGRETLEVIGEAYGVTRERIRQIESQAIEKIKTAPNFHEIIQPVEQLMISLLENHGGVLTKELMFELLTFELDKSLQTKQAIYFILAKLLDDKIEEITLSQKYISGWKLRLTSMAFVDEVINGLEQVINQAKAPQTLEKLYQHFQDIAKHISKIFKKKAYPPTVHNELILNDEYVLVGRGIYALAEWGFKEGVVSSVIAEVLKKANRPLTRNEVVEGVLKQRIVKKNTIHLALTDKEKFLKTRDGKYINA